MIALPPAFARRYRVLGCLGEGGMGRVYLAEHLYLGRLTALKLVHACSHDPRAEEWFRREALLAARIDHPRVARVYDFDVAPDGTCVLAMEYVAGATVRQRLERNGPFPVPEALDVLQAVAEGLDCAHELGILHRDLKPENVMLAARGGVKILDFGIALETPHAGGDAATQGTPPYMSPEHLLADPLTPASDIYSLGVLGYEMLTGRVPYLAVTPVELVGRVLARVRAPLDTVRPDAGPRLAAVLDRALAPDPAARWPSAGAFARAAREALELPQHLHDELACWCGVAVPAAQRGAA